jgi:hypothetical protein
VSDSHRFAGAPAVPVSELEGEPILLADPDVAPEYNAFVADLCQRAGFPVTPHRGTVQSLVAAVGLVGRRDCVIVSPRGVWHGSPRVRWVPLRDPAAVYTWSILWYAENRTPHVRRFVALARAHGRSHGWLSPLERRAS